MQKEIKRAFFEIRKGKFASLPSKVVEYAMRRSPQLKDYINSQRINLTIDRLLRSNRQKKASFESISVVYLLHKANADLFSRSIFSLKTLIVNPHVIIVDLGENDDKIWSLAKNYLPKTEKIQFNTIGSINELFKRIASTQDIRDHVLFINEYPKFNELVNVVDSKELQQNQCYCLDFLYPRRSLKNYYINKEKVIYYENLNLFRPFFPLLSKSILANFDMDNVLRSDFEVLNAALSIKELNKDFDLNNFFKNYFELHFPVVKIDDHEKVINYKFPFDKKISIIILTKDKIDLLQQCLKSIELSTYNNYEIIIVDHESNEESKNYLYRLGTKIIPFSGTYNFSRMNNLAAQEATGDVYCFLNNDTEVISPNWMEILGGFAVQNDIGAVGPKLLFKNNLIQHAGIEIKKNFTSVSHILTYEKDNALSKELKLIASPDAVTGACLFIEKEKFLKVGGFNEDYRLIWQDVDLCLNLHQHGFKTLFIPYTKLYHYESSTRRHEPNENERHDLEYFKQKWRHLQRESETTRRLNLNKLKGISLGFKKKTNIENPEN